MRKIVLAATGTIAAVVVYCLMLLASQLQFKMDAIFRKQQSVPTPKGMYTSLSKDNFISNNN